MQTRRQIRPHGPAVCGSAFFQRFGKSRLKVRVAVSTAQGVSHGHEPVCGGHKKIRPHTEGRALRHGPHQRQGMLRHTGQCIYLSEKISFHTIANVFGTRLTRSPTPAARRGRAKRQGVDRPQSILLLKCCHFKNGAAVNEPEKRGFQAHWARACALAPAGANAFFKGKSL